MSLSFFRRREAWVLAKGLEAMPGWATLSTVGVAVAALAYRGAWPTLVETFLLFASVLGVYGALHFPSLKSRLASAGLWVTLLISLGLPTPPRSIGVDFQTFYDGAQILFDHHQPPYLARGTTAFPFPTFLLIRALSLGGGLPIERTFLCFIGLQIVLLAIGFALMRRVVRVDFPDGGSDPAVGLIQLGLLFHPVVLGAIGLGNSSVVAGVALMCAVWCWRCRKGALSHHGAAIFLNLAWMIKPQLIMASAFFILCWCVEWRRGPRPLSRAATIGRIVLPWAAAGIVISLPIAFPGTVLAYREFPSVAITWHTYVAETYPNNYALSAILAKALARIWAIPVSQTLPFLTAGIASILILWNSLSLVLGRQDSLRAFLPWLLTCLFWTSLMWEWYLTLALAGLILMVAFESGSTGRRVQASALRFCVGIGFTMVLSSFTFVLGVLLLYFHSQALLAQEVAGVQKIDGR